ncbi:hypothetical protein DFO70_106394 [Cytobacillus firmus]|uniref:Uncharacterized protein n=2 Tax=Cytobacillus TaxID=2675230 RepID=A0A366JYW6_CYTFI|nr:hypothetical protein DFO70_106394 [Cytobacillus firmus]TDX42861.1 hypothetical protein DFO72_106394 [Cytobacillus oceanisediminis]
MLTHFLRTEFIRCSLLNVLREALLPPRGNQRTLLLGYTTN